MAPAPSVPMAVRVFKETSGVVGTVWLFSTYKPLIDFRYSILVALADTEAHNAACAYTVRGGLVCSGNQYWTGDFKLRGNRRV